MKHPESERIRKIRGSVSLRTFAEKFDTSASNISAIEADKQGLAIQLARKIATEFNITLDWLYGISENGGPSSTISDQIRRSVERAIAPLGPTKMPLSQETSSLDNPDSYKAEEFYKKIIEEKDKQIELLQSSLNDARNQTEYMKVLYNQLNVMYEHFKNIAEKD